MFLFKSGLPMDDIEKTSESRADQYRQVPGLVQKYYVLDKEGAVSEAYLCLTHRRVLWLSENLT